MRFFEGIFTTTFVMGISACNKIMREFARLYHILNLWLYIPLCKAVLSPNCNIFQPNFEILLLLKGYMLEFRFYVWNSVDKKLVYIMGIVSSRRSDVYFSIVKIRLAPKTSSKQCA